MTEEHKLLLVLASHFLTEYEDSTKEVDKDTKELMKTINRNSSKNIKGESEVMRLLSKGYDILAHITRSKEVTANALCLALGCCFLMIERGYLSLSTLMATKRLSWEIYSKLEVAQGKEQGFRNANRLITQLDERI